MSESNKTSNQRPNVPSNLPQLLRDAERRVNEHVWGDRRAVVSIPADVSRDVDILLLTAADEIERLTLEFRLSSQQAAELRDDRDRLRAELERARQYLAEAREAIGSFETRQNDEWCDELDAWLLGLSGRSAPETSAPHRDTERLKWLANTVLCCDYGDNSHPSKLIGWRVVEFVAPVIYGKTLEEAIDAGMDDEFHRRRQRSVKPTIADLDKILQSEDTTPVTILPDGTITSAPSAQETSRKLPPREFDVETHQGLYAEKAPQKTAGRLDIGHYDSSAKLDDPDYNDRTRSLQETTTRPVAKVFADADNNGRDARVLAPPEKASGEHT